jgi:AcrR family transcriptional regulator
MLSSGIQVVSEGGYSKMSVARVTGRAGVSLRTFYDLFDNRESCFLAVFDEAVGEMTAIAAAAYDGEQGWRAGIRAALAALLSFIDERPNVGALVVVEALGAGPRVLERRAEVVASLTAAIDRGRAQSGRRGDQPPLTAEGVVGAVLSVIHARLSERQPGSLLALLNHLMGMIVAPHLGTRAVAQEHARVHGRTRTRGPHRRDGGGQGQWPAHRQRLGRERFPRRHRGRDPGR